MKNEESLGSYEASELMYDTFGESHVTEVGTITVVDGREIETLRTEEEWYSCECCGIYAYRYGFANGKALLGSRG